MNVKPTNQIVLPVILYVFVLTTGCRNVNSAGGKPESASVAPAVSTTSDPVSELFGQFTLPPEIVVVSPSEKSSVQVGTRGCKLHIPADAFVFEDGSPVKSPVDIQFRDFTNKADILFSQIPMTFTENGEELCFNSAGMFEIKGACSGQKVKLAAGKEISVDYPLAQKPEGLAFYRFDEAANNWVKEQTIEKEAIDQKKTEPEKAAKQDAAEKAEARIELKNQPKVKAWLSSAYMKGGYPYIPNENGDKDFLDIRMNAEYKFPQAMYDYLFDNPQFYLAFEFDVDTVAGKLIRINPHPLNPTKDYNAGIQKYLEGLKGIKMFNPTTNYEVVENGENRFMMVFNDYPGREELVRMQTEQNALARNFILRQPVPDAKPIKAVAGNIAPAGGDPGHTYPDIVRGLVVSGFGIYNCDQAFRMGNLVQLKPVFVDEKNQSLENTIVVCVIQPDINSSFSFSPALINLNPDEDNLLVVFTTDRQIYLLSVEAFRNADLSSDKPKFVMENISAKIKSSDDLLPYLEKPV